MGFHDFSSPRQRLVEGREEECLPDHEDSNVVRTICPCSIDFLQESHGGDYIRRVRWRMIAIFYRLLTTYVLPTSDTMRDGDSMQHCRQESHVDLQAGKVGNSNTGWRLMTKSEDGFLQRVFSTHASQSGSRFHWVKKAAEHMSF